MTSAGVNELTQWNMSNGIADRRWTTQSGLVVSQKTGPPDAVNQTENPRHSRLKSLTSKRNKETNTGKDDNMSKKPRLDANSGNVVHKHVLPLWQDESMTTYKITVRTGHFEGAGTMAPVYIQMKGMLGEKSIKKRLVDKRHVDKKAKQMKFLAGSIIAFRHQNKDIGEIHSIKIDIDQVYEDECWYCESISVKNKKNGVQWKFNCNQWIGTNKEPGETFCILEPEQEEKQRNTLYQITTVTGSGKNSHGTTKVLITLYSNNDDTGVITLDKNRSSTFQKSHTDVFTIEALELSEIVKVRVRLPEDDPTAKDWFLERIVIKIQSKPDVAFFAACSNWISQFGMPTDLNVSTDPLKCIRNNRFRLTVFTGEVTGSGTSSDVFVNLLGTSNRSDDIRLSNDGMSFKKGAVAEFDIETTFLGGTLRQLSVSHDSTGKEPEWFLEKVIVDQLDCPKRVYEFTCHRWLSAERGNGLTSCTLLPVGLDADVDEADFGDFQNEDRNVFELTIRVSAESKPLKNAQSIYIVLFGEEQYGDSDNFIQISTGKILIKANFQASKVVEEKLIANNPSPVTQIALGLKNDDEEVLIEDVTLYCPNTCIEQYFWLSKWLSSSQEGEFTERVIYERIDRRMLKKPKLKWDVTLSAKKSTPMKGSVNLTFWGEEGSCDIITINKPDPEVSSMFMLADVGIFYKVTTEFIPDSSGDAMFLKRIYLSRSSKEYFTFDVKRWFSQIKGPFHTLTTDSPARSSSFDESTLLPVDRYNIVIKTASQKGAGTAAQVSLALVGETSDSGSRKLFPTQASPQTLFQAGKEDYFVFECVNLGPIDHIVLSHDGSDLEEHDWLVEEIRITCDERREDLKFPCGRWLSVNKHDCKTCVTLYPDTHTQFSMCRDYQILIKTADIQGNEEDVTNAFVILNGKNQSSSKLLLTESASNSQLSGLFNKGQSATFSFRTADLGEMQSIVIGHDSETKKWFIDKVFVSCEQRSEQTEFSCHRWIARSEGDGRLEVECLPSEIILGIPTTDYKLAFETGEHGTEGQIFVTISGSRTQTREKSFRNSTKNFSSGATDVFTFSDIDVGQVRKVRVKYIAAGKETWDLKAISLSRGKPTRIERSHGQFWTDKGVRFKYLFDDRQPVDLETTKIDLNYSFICDQLFTVSSERPIPVHEFVPRHSKERPKNKEWKVPYTVNIRASQDSQVVKQEVNKLYLNIIGSRGDTGLRCLGGKIPHPGKESSFEIDTVHIGTVEQVLILSENSLNCRIFSIELTANKKNLFFPADTSFDLHDPGSQLNHALTPMNKRLIEENFVNNQKSTEKKNWRLRDTFGLEMLRGKVIYTIRTFTGGKKLESSSATKIYAILHGNYGSSEKFILHDSRLHSEAFKKNETDEFDLETTDLGVIDRLTVGCDNYDEFKEFQIEKIEVRAAHVGIQWCFLNTRSREQNQTAKNQAVKLFECVNSLTQRFKPFQYYEIKIKTSSDVPAASTNANVFIQLYGDMARTEISNLVPRKGLREDCFNEGKTDIFIRELENVGESIKKIRIGHDNSGMKPGWHLEWVQIRVLVSEYKSRVFRFECKRWLARDEDDKAIERELNPKEIFCIKYDAEGKAERIEEEVERGSLKNYTVHVYTGDVPGAGTDANVFLTLYGNKGDSGERGLKHSDNNINKFEQNDHDAFIIEASDLGTLYKLNIRHDNKGAVGAAWFLDRIEVSESENSSSWSFFCERWLSKSDDDHKIERTLYAHGYHGQLLGEPDYSLHGFTTYVIRVHTGKDKHMGTDANACINIFGSNGSSTGKLPLEHVMRSKFEPATTEEFHLWAPDVGRALRRIDVNHDGLLASQSWFIETIEIDCPTLGKNYVCKMQSWLGVSREGCSTEKSVAVSDGETVNYLPKVPHLLNIFTGDQFEAGTDCEIQITLFGKRGTSEPSVIAKNENRLERGRRDVVLFNCEDVGAFLKLRVQLRENGFRKKWFLDKITLQAMNETGFSNNDVVEFVHNSWFDLKQGISSADIVAQINGKKMLKETDYKVSVTTSSIRGSGTDANVSMVLFGESGCSEELQLSESKTNTNKFERSHTDVFEFNRMLDLGNIFKTRIWHDNSGALASWHVKEIIVENKMDGKKCQFTCNKWLSRSEDDKQTCREFFADGFKKSQDDHEQAKFRAIILCDSSAGTDSTFGGGILTFQLRSNSRSTDYITVQLDSVRIKQKRIEVDFVATNLQNLTGMLLNFEPKQAGDYVHLKSVCILNLHTKMTSFIEVDRKLPTEKPREPVFVDYRPDPREVDFLSKLGVSLQMTYEIRVFTGDKAGAGTDSNVFITIFGSRGDSGKHKLAYSKQHINKFERNYLDTFDFKFSDLGDLKKVVIEHDDWGQGSAWYLERVEVVDVIRKTVDLFPCEKWLDKTKGDRQVCRELYSRQRKPLTQS